MAPRTSSSSRTIICQPVRKTRYQGPRLASWPLSDDYARPAALSRTRYCSESKRMSSLVSIATIANQPFFASLNSIQRGKSFGHRGIQAGCPFDGRAASIIKEFGSRASLSSPIAFAFPQRPPFRKGLTVLIPAKSSSSCRSSVNTSEQPKLRAASMIAASQ